MDVELSSLFYTISGIAFLFATPIAFILRSRKLMRRRVILYCALIAMGVGCIIRTGNLFKKKHVYWVYIGQCINGAALAVLSVTSFPEIVDAVEKTPEYPYYDKDYVNFYISGLFVMLAAIA